MVRAEQDGDSGERGAGEVVAWMNWTGRYPWVVGGLAMTRGRGDELFFKAGGIAEEVDIGEFAKENWRGN